MGIGLTSSISIYVVYYGYDNPRLSTGLKLVRKGFALRVRRPPRGSILLSPFSLTPISGDDREYVQRHGICVVDGSWRKLLDVESYLRSKNARRLPLLLAANPINYGLPFLLSSAEALSAALYITGFSDLAERILSVFKWGRIFFNLNNSLLEMYREKSVDDIVRSECSYLSRVLGASISSCEKESLLSIYRAIVDKYLKN